MLAQYSFSFVVYELLVVLYRNLQAAVCAYFDLQSFNKLPQMALVKDITIGEGESVPPSTKYACLCFSFSVQGIIIASLTVVTVVVVKAREN